MLVEARCDTSSDSSYNGGGVVGLGVGAHWERAAGGGGVQAVAEAETSQVGEWAVDDECNGSF